MIDGESMKINCNNYQTKEIIRFMRESTDKTQKEFAYDVNKTREWCAAVEGGKSNVLLKDFIELANINNIKITMSKEK